jgi:hypothetical protein
MGMGLGFPVLRKWELAAVLLPTVAVYAAGLALPIFTQRE